MIEEKSYSSESDSGFKSPKAKVRDEEEMLQDTITDRDQEDTIQEIDLQQFECQIKRQKLRYEETSNFSFKVTDTPVARLT